MGRKARRIIGVVAAIAVPFVAPAIASSIGLSAAIGSTAASAATGAVLGAGAAAIGGTNIAQGALMGGIGGGIAGYNYTPTPTASSAVPEGFSSGFSGDPSLANYSVTPTLTAGTSFDAMGNIIPVGAIDPTTGTAVSSLSGMNYGYGASGFGFPTAAPDLGTQLSTAGYSSGFPGDPSLAPAGLTPPTTVASGGYTYDAMGNVVQAGSIDPTTQASVGAGIPGVAPSSSVVSTPGTIAPTTTAATSAPTTFTEALKQMPGEIAAKFKDPKALADITLRAAGTLAGSAIAGDGMTPEERRLLEAERADLERLRTENEALFRERLAAAQNLLGESRYFDPEYFGLQSARRSQLAGARSRQAGLRGLRGRQRDVAARQFELETAKTTGTAYDVGAQTGLTGRIQTQQAGLFTMPTSFPSVSYAGLRGAYDSAAERRAAQQKDIGKLFGTLTG
jgi:hypothetical protein